jgi:hypothetical protein
VGNATIEMRFYAHRVNASLMVLEIKVDTTFVNASINASISVSVSENLTGTKDFSIKALNASQYGQYGLI